MIKKLRLLSAFAAVFAFGQSYAQSYSCDDSDSATGGDQTQVTASITDFSCVDTVANSWITDFQISARITNTSGSSSYCNYYYFDLKINGNVVETEQCASGAAYIDFDASDYVEDINSITSVEVVSYDQPADNYNDQVKMWLETDIEYIVTTCPPPSYSSATNITSTSADFTLSPNGTEAAWQYELLNITNGDTADGSIDGTLVDTNAMLSGLNPDTEYAVYVRAVCGASQSLWNGPISFTTDPTCIPVTGVGVSNVTDVSALIDWTSTEDEWEIEYINITNGDTFTGNPNVLGIATTSHNLSSLAPETEYSFKVRSNCGVIDGNSTWSNAVNFTTDPSCIAPSDLTMTSVTDTSITVSWTSNDDEALWNLEVINLDNGETQDFSDDFTAFSTTSFTITGLNPATDYEIFVNAQCTPADSSDWTSGLEVQTLCSTFPMPWSDSLDTWVADCFELGPHAGTWTGNNWKSWSPAGGIIEAPFWGISSGTIFFETATIDITEEGLFYFSYSYGWNSSYDDQMNIYYSTDGGTTWTQIWSKMGTDMATQTSSSNTSPSTWKLEEVLLPASLVGQSVKFKFEGVSDYGPDFFLDYIGVKAMPDCNPAYGLEVTSTTTTSATAEFTDVTDLSTQFDYIAYNSNDTVTGNTSSTPFTINGLEASSIYNLMVTTICSNGDTVDSDIVTFQTECEEFSSFFENFDGTNSNEMPICWGDIEANVTSTNNYVGVTSGSAYSGSKKLRFYSGNQTSNLITDLIAYTPELDSVSTHWFTFFARKSGPNQILQIGYITDVTDEDSFVSLEEIAINSNSYQFFSFKPSDYPAFTGNRIGMRFKFTGTYDYIYVDNATWEHAPNCFAPTDVAIDSVGTTMAYGSLTPADTNDTEWAIELINLSNGDTVSGMPNDTINSTNFTLTNLEPNSVYHMYVRTNCALTESSWIIDPVEFITGCTAVDTIYEDFELGVAPCWNFIAESSSGSVQSSIYNSLFYSNGAYSARFYKSYSAADIEILMVSPEMIDLTNLERKIVFEARKQYSWVSNPTVQVGTMSDNEDPSTFTWIAEYPINTTSFQTKELSFAGYTGTDKYIAFRLKESSGFGSKYLLLDDIRLEELDSCAIPNNLSATNVTDVTADINWIPYSVDSLFYYEVINVTAGDTFTYVADDSTANTFANLTGLTPASEYQFIVKNTCDSNWTYEETFYTEDSYDIQVNDILNAEEGCMLTTTEEVTIELENSGAQDATGFEVYYSFDDTTYTLDGVYSDTIAFSNTANYTLATTFDFSSAQDTTIYIKIVQVGDADTTNNVISQSITNLGNHFIQVQVNTGSFGTEPYFEIVDTVTGNVQFAYDAYGSNQTYFHDVCLYTGSWYSMDAYDSYGDGWNGGTYELTHCFGAIIVNNGGNEVTNGGTTYNPNDLEVQEFFYVEACPDNDLGIVSFDSISSSCGMTANEVGYVNVKNLGQLPVHAGSNAKIQYKLNGSAWTDLYTFPDTLASNTSKSIALPVVDMSNPGTFTFEFQVVFAADSNVNNNSLMEVIQSIPTLTEANQDFNTSLSGWTSHQLNASGTLDSWEWGVPTTANISNGAQGKVWALDLDTNAALNEESFLMSPCFDFSSYTADVEVKFDYIWASPTTSHRVYFDYSTNGGSSWSTVDVNPSWPTYFGITNSWDSLTMIIPGLAGEDDVKFRFRYDATWLSPAEGFAFDNFNVFEHIPYTDATLSDLTVNGVTVPGFHPDTLNYTYELPYGFSGSIPTIFAVANAPIVSDIDIDQATAIPGQGTVTVVAEDTNYSLTYTVNFVEADPDSNADLSNLAYNGTTVPGFTPATTVYNVSMPFGSAMPVTTASLAAPTSSMTITQASLPYPDTAFVHVVAQDTNVTKTYMVIYDEDPADTNSYLDMIQINGANIVGFSPTQFNYPGNLITTGSAAISYNLPSGSLATVTMNPPSGFVTSFPATVTITVTAQDTNYSSVYTVELEEPLSSNAYLDSLLVDGTMIAGFDSSVTVYHYDTLPYGTTVPPVVGGIAADPNATIDTNAATSVPGVTQLVVTAEDGTVMEYFVNFYVYPPNTNSSLSNLSSNWTGQLTPSFDPAVFNYTLCITDTAKVLNNIAPTLIATAEASTSNIDFSPDATYTSYNNETITITVTAQDGSQSTYTVLLDPCGIGTEEEIDPNSISIYPNPSNGSVFVQVDNEINNIGITVFNTIGQKILNKEFTNNSNEHMIDLSEFNNGVYHILVEDLETGKSIRKKITLLK
jgi:hypothetical protein